MSYLCITTNIVYPQTLYIHPACSCSLSCGVAQGFERLSPLPCQATTCASTSYYAPPNLAMHLMAICEESVLYEALNTKTTQAFKNSYWLQDAFTKAPIQFQAPYASQTMHMRWLCITKR